MKRKVLNAIKQEQTIQRVAASSHLMMSMIDTALQWTAVTTMMMRMFTVCHVSPVMTFWKESWIKQST